LVAYWVSGLSLDIVDPMSTVKELMPSPAGTVFEPLGAVVDEPDEPDEQPAAVRATTARPAQPTRRKRRDVPWP
jgi:hypothetical protein